jgi:hypothetical protein
VTVKALAFPWLAAVAAALALPVPAQAGPSHAEEVLAEAQELLDPASGPPAEPTAVLGQLAAAEDRLEGRDRRLAEALLARPDDGESDRYNDGFTVDEATGSPACSADFCVHWVPETADAPDLSDENGTDDDDGVPDVVEDSLESAEHSQAVQNGSLGWAEPLSDGGRGGGGPPGRTDIYLIDTNGAYFGYASPDEGQGPVVSKFAYLVLDEDMAEFDDEELTRLEALRATMAHEYNHVLQFTYDSLNFGPNLWMFESTATWAEEKVYPEIDDYLNYVRSYAATTAKPLTLDDGGLRVYGSAMWNHFLDGSEGSDAIRSAWENLDEATPEHLGPAAYDAALGGDGASPYDELGSRYAEFAALSAEWRALPGAFPDAEDLPSAARSGRLRPGEPAREVALKHLSHALLRIRPSDAAGGVTLKVRCPDTVQCVAALVTRDGPATAGTVDPILSQAPDGGPIGITLPPGEHDRVTAVVGNADASVNVFGRYTSDESSFRVRLKPE